MKSFLRKLVPGFLVSLYHFKLVLLSAIFYGFPSRKLKVIGVTGTKGKSTTVYVLGKILEDAGHKVGWTSSLSIKIGKKEKLNPYHLTMPGRFFIQKSLRQMVKEKCEYAIIEVTSEGIKQHRHRFIKFDTAIFTNLHPEHIEAHHGFDNYKKAKAKLFKSLGKNGKIIANLDDENALYYLNFPAKEKIGFGLLEHKDFKNYFRAKNYQVQDRGIYFELKDIKFFSHLLGEFNLYNILAAAVCAFSEGVSFEKINQSLEKIKKIEGRMEEIKTNRDFRVFVDLAHTPDSFEQVFNLVKRLGSQKIISVFGSAGGGRDKWKRPKLGAIASQYSDYIIITNEDPYDENPQQIALDIQKGIGQSKKTEIILNRREAIKKALQMAQAGDIVLILGKGTEATLVVGDHKYAWDDRKVTEEELGQL